MLGLSGTAYLWVKALHVISVIAWMAALLYLPRLFVYHSRAEPGSELSETLKVMERRLLRAIMTPAMAAAVVFGVILLLEAGSGVWSAGWLHVKFAGVLGLAILHGLMARWRGDFAHDRNRHSERFFRFVNEVPTVLMIIIVILAIVEPF